MASGNLQFGNNGVGNDAVGDRTTLTSVVPLNPTGIPTGTLTVSDTGTGSAIVGETDNNVAAIIGVNNGSGAGVAGSNAFSGIGVRGDSEGFIGVFGDSVRSAGALGRTSSSNGVEGQTSGTGWAGAFFGRTGVVGNLFVFGNFTVVPPGAKSMAMRHPDGSYRRLYSLESPETWFEDFGRGELVDGRAQVELDPDYAALVQLEDYHVFLTPEGDSAGLYIAGKSPTGFEVREQQGGTSSLTFSYRVAARPKDVPGERLARIDEQEISPPVEAELP
jgi:hypothetical protein